MSVPCTCNFLEISTGHAPDCPSFSHAPAPSAAHAGLLDRVDVELCGLPSDTGLVTVDECASGVLRLSHEDDANLRRLLAARLLRLAAALRSASPAAGAVEEAYREGYADCYKREFDFLPDIVDVEEGWSDSAARRGAAGGV